MISKTHQHCVVTVDCRYMTESGVLSLVNSNLLHNRQVVCDCKYNFGILITIYCEQNQTEHFLAHRDETERDVICVDRPIQIDLE